MNALTAKKHTERNRHRDRKKIFSETSEGCVIPVRNNSLNDSKWHFLEPNYYN